MIPAALVESTQITPLLYAQPFTSNGVDHPANALTLWTPAQLKKVGVYPLVHAQSPLPYHVAGTPTYALVNGEVIESRTDTPMPLADVKALKQSDIDAEVETSIQAMTAGYPAAERESWAVQEAEAEAYTVNNAAPTPFLSGLATARGVPVATIVTKVIANASAFKAASSAFIGKRQARSDALKAATTFAEAINV